MAMAWRRSWVGTAATSSIRFCEAEMDAAVSKAIADTKAASIKQMGAVVKAAKEILTGKTVDGKALSDRVRERLSKLA